MSTLAPLDSTDMVPEDRPQSIRQSFWLQLLKTLASLQLTVVLFALAIGLIFLGTLAQKTAGIWTVIDRYFWSWVVFVDLQPTLEFGKIFFGLSKDAKAPDWAVFPYPGGKLIGGLMFLNLIAAHIYRFRLTWKKCGLWVAHAGLMLFFVGEYITREFQQEQRMVITEGQSVNFTEDNRTCELAFTTPDAEGDEKVIVIPQWQLVEAARHKGVIQDSALPVDVRVESYMVNSTLADVPAAPAETNPATHGLGLRFKATPKPEASGVDTDAIDLPSAYVTLLEKGTDKSLGTYLVSLWFTYDIFNRQAQPKQSVTIDGTTYELALRYKRYYKPFSLYLVKFRFDRYIGTENAKNYSSDLILIDPERGQERDVRIAMNEPLYYRGETFYQVNFDKTTEKTTVLQVVRNPGWIVPYLACGMVSAGLLIHFLISLAQYLTLRKPERAPVAEAPLSWLSVEILLPAITVTLVGLMLARMALPKSYDGPKQLKSFVSLPVVDGGRMKPLDTVARVFLRKISGREEFVNEDGKMRPAIEWLMDVMAGQDHGPGWNHRVLRIDNDQVRSLLGLERREGFRYSMKDIEPRIPELRRAIEKARQQLGQTREAASDKDERVDRFFESTDRDVFAGQVLEIGERVSLVFSLAGRRVPLMLPMPPEEGKSEERTWRSLQDAEMFAMLEVLQAQGLMPRDLPRLSEEQRKALQQQEAEQLKAIPGAAELLKVLDDYQWVANRGDSTAQAQLENSIQNFRKIVDNALSPSELAKIDFEVFMNEFAPTYGIIYVYVLALLFALLGFVLLLFGERYAEAFRRTSFALLALGFLVHAFALVGRMYLQDRWLVFVTNLYSTAVFIGWAAIGIGLVIERILPLGLGNLLGSVVGVATAILAHNLATSRDTLEMMQAVLDTNFWLATHVTTINLGYSITYLAGFGGIAYVLVGLFTPHLRRPIGVGPGGRTAELGKTLSQLIYGIVCAATLTSFVGTVLGGIWADYSWGRFWGWDPKENGAILIVLWNAMILHARWCGLVKDRGVAVMAIFGNIITTWSYFGTNQLGVGLHAYGFNNALAVGCVVTWGIHALIIALGLIPTRLWRSFASPQIA